MTKSEFEDSLNYENITNSPFFEKGYFSFVWDNKMFFVNNIDMTPLELDDGENGVEWNCKDDAGNKYNFLFIFSDSEMHFSDCPCFKNEEKNQECTCSEGRDLELIDLDYNTPSRFWAI